MVSRFHFEFDINKSECFAINISQVLDIKVHHHFIQHKRTFDLELKYECFI